MDIYNETEEVPSVSKEEEKNKEKKDKENKDELKD